MRYWIIIIGLICVACGSNSSEQVLPTLVDFPTETIAPTTTETIFVASATATATVTDLPTETVTASLTSSPEPSATFTLEPSATNTSTVQASVSFGEEEDIVVAWLLETDNVDAVELITLDRSSDSSPLFYAELIVYPGYNDLLLAVILKEFVEGEFGISEFASFDVNISDGIQATNYYFGFGEWDVTELTLVTPPTPSSNNSDGTSTCDCNSVDGFCSNFANQSSAQACYDQCIGSNSSLSNLDRDADGLVCESLP